MNETSNEQPSVAARMRLLIGDQGKLIVATGFLVTLSALAEVVTLALIAQIAATLVKVNNTHVRLSVLHIHAPTKTLILVAFVIAIARLLLLQVPQTLLPARVMANVWARLRMNLFEAFGSASWELQSREREGKLQEIMTNQAGQATQGLGSFLSLINSTLTFAVMLISAFVLNLFAAVIVVALAAVMLATLRPLRRLGRRRARALSRAQVNYAATVAESIRIAEETHVFGVGASLRSRMDKRVATSRRLMFQTQLLGRIGSNVSETFVYLLLVCGLLILNATGDKHVASLGAVVLILVRASSSAQNIQGAYQSLIQAMPFVELVQETQRRYEESRLGEGIQPLPHVTSLAFSGVGYAYRAGRPVLSDIHFNVNEGEVVGIIGPSGAGKSTLVQLLLRLRAPSEGSYLVNGISAPEIAIEDWRRQVTYVPQEPRLLHASVAENIRFFREIDDEAVQRAG
ncbi:MAG TPA: ABC transporter ATP-binding protein, partial [Solirubrobacteraceae bacterium]|nr:ABC transporter ATP-binding protein [Solirubrobacteraceae bacterium]